MGKIKDVLIGKIVIAEIVKSEDYHNYDVFMDYDLMWILTSGITTQIETELSADFETIEQCEKWAFEQIEKFRADYVMLNSLLKIIDSEETCCKPDMNDFNNKDEETSQYVRVGK